MTSMMAPSVNLEAMHVLQFDYDGDDDIAYIHIDGPRSAITEQVDDAWYLRLAQEDGEVVGMELHGLRSVFLKNPYFTKAFLPSIEELEAYTGLPFARASLRIEGTVERLPRTTHLIILLIGLAIGMYDAHLRDDAEPFADVDWN